MITHGTMAPPVRYTARPDPAPSVAAAPQSDAASGVSSAFARYAPAADDSKPATVRAPGTNRARFSPAAMKAALRAMPGYIDGLAILRRVIRQWESQGNSPEQIKAIESGVSRQPDDRDAPAIFALGAALRASGDYDRLRTQAINVYRGTCAWKNTVELMQARHPGLSRGQLENRLAAIMFRLDGADHRHDAAVLDRLLRPEGILESDSDDGVIDGDVASLYSTAGDTNTGMPARRRGAQPPYV